MTKIQYFHEYAERLLDNGFYPIPIVEKQKRPAVSGWNKFDKIDNDQYQKLIRDHTQHGIGILLGKVCVIDVDIMNKDLSFEIIKLIKDIVGQAPMRIGKSPKAALFFRVIGETFSKSSTESYINGGEKNQVEFLATGTQIVISGIHPKTGKNYLWVDDNIMDMNIKDLPPIDIKQVDYLKVVIEKKIFSFFGQPVPRKNIFENKTYKPNCNVSNEEILKDIESPLKYLDPQNYDQWISVGMALKSTNIRKAIEIFQSWSKKRPDGSIPVNYKGPDDVLSKWKTFNPQRTSIETIFKKAKDIGWNGKSDFIIIRGSHTEVAKYIKALTELNKPPLVFDEGFFWLYKETHWEKCESHVCREWIQNLDGLEFQKKKYITSNKNFIDGVLNELSSLCARPGFFGECSVGINCLSGFIKVTDKPSISLLEHHHLHRQRHTIQSKWQPDQNLCIDGFLKIFLDGCFKNTYQKEKLIRLLFQISGVACSGYSTRLPSPKAFVLYGPTAMNGKSQFLKLLRGFLPKTACTSIPPGDLNKEQYLADLAGKNLNITDELSGSHAITSDKMKAVITGETVSAKVIYKYVFNFDPKALHLFAANELPNFVGGVDAGIERRMIVIPFKRSIPNDEQIPMIAEKIVNLESNVLLTLSVKGLEQVIQNGGYEIPSVVSNATDDWFRDADVILEWFDEGDFEENIKKNNHYNFKSAYNDFCLWVKDNYSISYIPPQKRFSARLRGIANNSDYIIGRNNKGYYISEKRLV